MSFFLPALLNVSVVVFFAFLLVTAVDYFFLFVLAKAPRVSRGLASRLSNGDDNTIELNITNGNHFYLCITIIDELPLQLQERNFKLYRKFEASQSKLIPYLVRPTERGEYHFGNIILFASTFLGLVERRFVIRAEQTVKVFPSFMQMKKFQLISNSATNNEPGSQRKRKIGQSMEFEQIKDYITGDDIRTINWKATARRGNLMVNHFVDEKSQQVYCIIDKGRLMKMPFNGLSLLDYAINATLALSNVCLQKKDKIGLVSFSNKLDTLIPAEKKLMQRENMLQALYKEQTSFLESDYEMLYTQIRSKIKQRSLLVLFTNFESVSGLKRQINYLRSIARHHLLLVVFFENTELHHLSHEPAITISDVYVKTVAEKFVFEKKMVVKELQKYGIISILTAPEKLTVNTINKYLELKSRQAL
jgi:uncharacterized protein (DUF58 family)